VRHSFKHLQLKFTSAATRFIQDFYTLRWQFNRIHPADCARDGKPRVHLNIEFGRRLGGGPRPHRANGQAQQGK